MLPFREAIYLPFDFYYSIRFNNLNGTVILNSKNIFRGMIKIGGRGSEMFTRSTTIVDIGGSIIFNGTVEIGHGVLLKVNKNAVIKFGDNVRIGALTLIFCNKNIIFGNEIDFSWRCQIFDTNFHYIRNKLTNLIDEKDEAISIGSYNWFGNNVSVMKGTITPDNLIFASNTLCNKNYMDYPEYSVLGGTPAKLIQHDKQRIFENIEDI